MRRLGSRGGSWLTNLWSPILDITGLDDKSDVIRNSAAQPCAAPEIATPRQQLSVGIDRDDQRIVGDPLNVDAGDIRAIVVGQWRFTSWIRCLDGDGTDSLPDLLVAPEDFEVPRGTDSSRSRPFDDHCLVFSTWRRRVFDHAIAVRTRNRKRKRKARHAD